MCNLFIFINTYEHGKVVRTAPALINNAGCTFQRNFTTISDQVRQLQYANRLARDTCGNDFAPQYTWEFRY